MQTFLHQVLEKLLTAKNQKLSEITFVLPSQRAGGFLKNLLKTEFEYSGFVPKILSTEDFIVDITGLRPLDNINSLFRFYEAYKKLTPKKNQEDFDVFYGWAQTLIYDFNEVDRHLINTEKFYNYLAEIQNVEHWSLAQPQTELVKSYLDFWNKLPEYHNQFVTSILKENQAYQGLIYRKAAEQIKGYLNKTENQIVFIGFNALNKAEQEIIQTVLQHKKGQIFWDIDEHFYADPEHEAGHFMRTYRNDWTYYTEANNPFEWVGQNFEKEKNIKAIGIPKNIGQAKYVGEILKDKDLQNTAVVLSDEGLLAPVLNSLPEKVKDLNITMGLPLDTTPPASLFETLYKIQKESKQDLYYKHVLDILGHPAVNLALEEVSDELQMAITKENRVFLSKQYVLNQCSDPNKKDILKLCFTNFENVEAFLEALITLTKLLQPKDVQTSPLETEYLFHFNTVFKKLQNLIAKENPIKSIKALHRIYSDLLKNESLDFRGAPFNNLQIMGMLETRVIDYETIILTSVNEGVLPSGKSSNSFIPYDLKRHFGLPTYKEKDAVYSYHFYRLLQRAKNIYLLYNSDQSSFNSGEKSRFITQLEVECLKQHKLTKQLINPDNQAPTTALKEFKKTSEVLEILKKQAVKGISPSALITYIRNPLDFYKKYVLNVGDRDEVEETIAANTLGTVIHETLECFYKPHIGKILTSKDIDQMKSKIDAEVKNQFKNHYNDAPLNEGKNLVVFEVAKKYIAQFLNLEQEELKKQDIRIRHIENKQFKKKLTIPELDFPVYLRGTVDRVDEKNDKIRVIDYKTGKVTTSELKISEWENLTADEKYSKAFQVLCYASILMQQTGYSEVQAGVISFKNLHLKDIFIPFIDQTTKTKKIDKQVLDSFHIELNKLIKEIFDPEIPFKEKEIEEYAY